MLENTLVHTLVLSQIPKKKMTTFYCGDITIRKGYVEKQGTFDYSFLNCEKELHMLSIGVFPLDPTLLKPFLDAFPWNKVVEVRSEEQGLEFIDAIFPLVKDHLHHPIGLPGQYWPLMKHAWKNTSCPLVHNLVHLSLLTEECLRTIRYGHIDCAEDLFTSTFQTSLNLLPNLIDLSICQRYSFRDRMYRVTHPTVEKLTLTFIGVGTVTELLTFLSLLMDDRLCFPNLQTVYCVCRGCLFENENENAVILYYVRSYLQRHPRIREFKFGRSDFAVDRINVPIAKMMNDHHTVVMLLGITYEGPESIFPIPKELLRNLNAHLIGGDTT